MKPVQKGKTIEQVGIYRRYEANITRIFRSGLEILPTRDTTIELGDTVRVVGKRDLLPDIRQELGNSLIELAHPNTVPLFLGIVLGILLGSIPVFIPGLPAPIFCDITAIIPDDITPNMIIKTPIYVFAVPTAPTA